MLSLRYLARGEYLGRGRPRKSAGKIDLTDCSNFELVTQLSDDVALYTAVVWSISFKRKIRLVYLLKTSASNSNAYAVLFSTDLELDAYSIYLYGFVGFLRRRNFDSQAAELLIQCAVLNRMIQLGKPDTYTTDI